MSITATIPLSAMTLEELMQHADCPRYFFRIAYTDCYACACCGRSLGGVGFVALTQPIDGADCDAAGVLELCVPCVIAGGRQCVLEAARKETERFIEMETDFSLKDMWAVTREQFERGLFEIAIPETVAEIGRLMAAAASKHADEQEEEEGRLFKHLRIART